MNNRFIALILTIIGIFPPLTAGQDLTFEQESSLPMWARSAFSKSGLLKQYAMVTHINPFYQRGDFDGDGNLDIAIWIKHRLSKKLGLVIIHRSSGHTYLIGAGNYVVDGEGKPLWPKDGDDLKFIDAWITFDKDELEYGLGKGPPLKPKGDALLLVKTESASGLIWWNGTFYSWHQQGD